jgi:hypothetical protein
MEMICTEMVHEIVYNIIKVINITSNSDKLGVSGVLYK